MMLQHIGFEGNTMQTIDFVFMQTNDFVFIDLISERFLIDIWVK